MSGIVAFLGHLPMERQSIDRLAWKNGWSFRHTAEISDLASLSDRNVIAVLFDPKELNTDWRAALRDVREAAPHALPVVCQRFSEAGQWADMANAGVYNILHRPFAVAEVQQCFGFIRQAQRRQHERGDSRWPAPAPLLREREKVAGAV